MNSPLKKEGEKVDHKKKVSAHNVLKVNQGLIILIFFCISQLLSIMLRNTTNEVFAGLLSN